LYRIENDPILTPIEFALAIDPSASAEKLSGSQKPILPTSPAAPS
jgi:hypothetical protein